MTSQYLPLTEYSSKYKVSISTLRRRIKADEIKYVFEDGKYMILDEKPVGHQGQHRPSPAKSPSLVASPMRPSPKNEQAEMTAKTRKLAVTPDSPAKPSKAPPADSLAEHPVQWNEEFAAFDIRDRQQPILTAANRLLTELKKAYTQILQEKEEQILELKEEVSDLKTLVRVLESENARGKRK